MKDYKDQLRNDHTDFDKGIFEGPELENPFDLFDSWMKNAVEQGQIEANAMSISTVDNANRISSRIVYLKEMINNTFVFYTNYTSRKGQDIEQTEMGSILFFWPQLQQQIRIEGRLQKVSPEMSDAYFASRPRGSQLGAWASHQSEELKDRKELEDRLVDLEAKFPTEVPRPDNWGGYALVPDYFEFWQGRPSRLHDRFVFVKEKEEWLIKRLNP